MPYNIKNVWIDGLIENELRMMKIGNELKQPHASNSLRLIKTIIQNRKQISKNKNKNKCKFEPLKKNSMLVREGGSFVNKM